MRLIALRFQGLGPYAGECSIDFAALTRSRMFLIDGETGVGKTTILDCVTFALYGGLSAATDGKAKQRIRSKFLDTALTETYVDLIIEVGGAYCDIRRTPEYERADAGVELRGGLTPTISARVASSALTIARMPVTAVRRSSGRRMSRERRSRIRRVPIYVSWSNT